MMDIVEIEQKETVSRKEVATRLRRLATQLSKGNEVNFDQGGMAMKVHVPDEVQLKVELEVETDERELEIALKW
jgi:amphi-Trp domain-containing protein